MFDDVFKFVLNKKKFSLNQKKKIKSKVKTFKEYH